MPRIERVTTTVTLLDVVMSDPPAIITRERLVDRGGRVRSFTQKAPVVDRLLFQRLLAQVKKGDEVVITTETDWDAPGLPLRLADFAPIAVGASVSENST